VQQHEGYIDVATKVGQGTVFTLYFPSLDIDAREVAMPDPASLQHGQGQLVLVVEDNSDTRQALMDSLVLMNYSVIDAANGREALSILEVKANDITLVLSDAVMPEMGGIALFHAMQKNGLAAPLVLLTGHPLSKEMEELQTLGLAGWLPKPPDIVKLSQLLAQVLSG
jgi:DNA-binding NtrC family response regulator